MTGPISNQTLHNQIGNLYELTTDSKLSLVDAINESIAAVSAAQADANGLKAIKIVTAAGAVSYVTSASESSSAADKRTAVNSAIQTLNNGDSVYLPPWTIEPLAATGITLTSKIGVKIIGPLTMKATAAVDRPEAYLKLSSCVDCVVDGLTIDGGGQSLTTGGSAGIGIYLDDCVNTTLRNITLMDGSWGTTNCSGIRIDNDRCTLENITITDWRYHLQFVNPKRVYIKNFNSYYTKQIAADIAAAVTISVSSNVATVTDTAHGLSSAYYIYINGCTDTDLNGTHYITVTGTDTYTFSTPAANGSDSGNRFDYSLRRHLNASDWNDGSDTSCESFIIDGAEWIASGEYEAVGFDMSMNSSAPMKNLAFRNFFVDHQDGIVAQTPTWGKMVYCDQMLLDNVVNLCPFYTKAVRMGYPCLPGAQAVIRNSRFVSGGLGMSGTGGNDPGRILRIENSRFENCHGNRELYTNGQNDEAEIYVSDIACSVQIDSQSYFGNCGRWFHDMGGTTPGLRNVFDCLVEFDTATWTYAYAYVLRYAGPFDAVRIGPHFRCTNTESNKLFMAGSLRQAVTDLNGIGHFDHAMAKYLDQYIGTATTCGISITASTAHWNHLYVASGDPFPALGAKHGDRMVNDNWGSNSMAKSWVHDGTQWQVEIA